MILVTLFKQRDFMHLFTVKEIITLLFVYSVNKLDEYRLTELSSPFVKKTMIR